MNRSLSQGVPTDAAAIVGHGANATWGRPWLALDEHGNPRVGFWTKPAHRVSEPCPYSFYVQGRGCLTRNASPIGRLAGGPPFGAVRWPVATDRYCKPTRSPGDPMSLTKKPQCPVQRLNLTDAEVRDGQSHLPAASAGTASAPAAASSRPP